MKECYKDLFRYISETDESCATDILYSLELVKTSLNTTLKRIKKEIQVAAEQNAFDGIRQITVSRSLRSIRRSKPSSLL